MTDMSRIKKYIPIRIKRFIWRVTRAEEWSLPSGRRVFVFLTADYGNIGDLAIAAAQMVFLDRVFGRDREIVDIPIGKTDLVAQSIRRQLAKSDLITIIGGGNMGIMYEEIEKLRQFVIKKFPNNRIDCFPQTLDWDDSARSERALQKIVSIYSQHPDLHLFASESVSLEKLQALFIGRSKIKIGLAPDIVMSASAVDLGGVANAKPEGVLLCLRGDAERLVSDSDRLALEQGGGGTGLPISITDTHAGGAGLPAARCAELLAGKIIEFQNARLVVTDRLHGMILAALAGTPCLVLPNSNHKIRQTWQDWLTQVPQVRFLALAELADAGKVIRELLEIPRGDPAAPVVDSRHFAGLRAALEAS